MKKFQEASEGSTIAANDSSQALPEDFSPDDLYTLKALFLELEKVGCELWQNYIRGYCSNTCKTVFLNVKLGLRKVTY